MTYGSPDTLDAFFIGQLVKNSITAKQDKVVRVVDVKTSDFWASNDDTLSRLLRFEVSKSSADGEPSRENSDGSDDYLWRSRSALIV